ncbi:MAG: hypothetical protein QME49_07350 [bacterium]|nr:hypothetical protein [bacterium]
MRKIFLSCLMVGIMAMPALAGLNYPDIDVKGDLSLKSITADDYDNNSKISDKEDYVQMTAKLLLSADLTENVGLKATLRNVSKQGAGNNGNLDAVLSQTEVYQVNLDVKDIAGKVDAVIGRQNIGEKKNALVYQSSTADAIKLSTKCGPVDVTYVSANGPAKCDTLNAIMLGGKIGPVNAGLARYTAQSSSASADEVLDLIVSGKIPVGCGIDASLEYAKQSGGKVGTVEKDATAMLIKLGCGGCDLGVGKVTCGLTYLNTSGDESGSANRDEAYSGINPSLKLTEIVSDKAAGQKNDDLGYNTSIANRNAIVLNIGLAPAAVDGLNLGLAYGKYETNEKVNNETEYATEINLTANYKASDAVSLSLLLAQMDPGKVIISGTDKAIKIQAGMKIGF